MTKDDVIRMARGAGFADGVVEIVGLEGFANFYNIAVAAQKEADAKLIEEYPYWLGTVAKREIAAAIRARGTT